MGKGSVGDQQKELGECWVKVSLHIYTAISPCPYVVHGMILYLFPISDLRSLYGLSGLTSLVLDCNEVTSHSVFPSIPNLQVLWLNKNKISNLSLFLESAILLFPRLRQLSMMNNPAAPSYFNGGSKQDYLDYR